MGICSGDTLIFGIVGAGRCQVGVASGGIFCTRYAVRRRQKNYFFFKLTTKMFYGNSILNELEMS